MVMGKTSDKQLLLFNPSLPPPTPYDTTGRQNGKLFEQYIVVTLDNSIFSNDKYGTLNSGLSFLNSSWASVLLPKICTRPIFPVKNLKLVNLVLYYLEANGLLFYP